MTKDEQYQQAISAIEGLIHGETDEIAVMATVYARCTSNSRTSAGCQVL